MAPDSHRPTQPAGITFREFVAGSRDHEAALRLRDAVLRKPLGLAFTADEIAEEPDCFHLGAFDRGEVKAVLLLKRLSLQEIKMRQVAVEPESQGRGIGSRLVAFAENYAKEKGYRMIRAHARETATGFYRKAGYRVRGESFLEHGIPHQLVAKRL